MDQLEVRNYINYLHDRFEPVDKATILVLCASPI